MNRQILRLVIAVLAIFLLSPCGVDAARKPAVVSHDETYASRTIRFRVAWQSENPVVVVKIFAGKEQKEIKVDEYDNRRTRDGYSGEVSAVVELDPAFAEESLAYAIQLEDDARLKSDLLTGKVQVVKARKDDDQWGQDKLTSSPTGMPMGTTGMTGSTGVEILDRVVGVMDRFDLAPVLGNITITRVGTDGVTISTRASDDKALSGVTFKIFDATGNLVEQDSAAPTGKSWEGTSKTFNLANGNYKAVVQATDGTGNTSTEKTQFFAITGSSLTSQPPYTGVMTTPDQTTIPVDQTTIPVDQTTIPVDQTTTPVDQTTTPVDQTTTPQQTQ